MTTQAAVYAVVVGQRVALKEAEGRIHPAGTVRYFGEVDGHKGIWVGVEWDNPSRGRHDGEVQGRRYFQCSIKGENSATFVRPQKLQHGVSLYEALMEQYTVTRGDYKGQPLYNTNTGRRRMVLELRLEPNRKDEEGDAGQGNHTKVDTSAAEPQGHLNDCQVESSRTPISGGLDCNGGLVCLTEAEAEVHRQLALRGRASVSALPVRCLGQAGQVTEMMRGVKDLDLSYNLLTDWKDVCEVVAALPAVTGLDLSHSRVCFPDILTPSPSPHHDEEASFSIANPESGSRAAVAAAAGDAAPGDEACTAARPPSSLPDEQRGAAVSADESAAAREQVVASGVAGEEGGGGGSAEPVVEAATPAGAAVVAVAAGAITSLGNHPIRCANGNSSSSSNSNSSGDASCGSCGVAGRESKAGGQWGLESLVLVDCRITWNQVLAVASQVPKLTSLNLADNRLTHLNAPPRTLSQLPAILPALTSLDLSRNGISDWSLLHCLTLLPSLRELHLSTNQIARISSLQIQGKLEESTVVPPLCFPNLIHLSLNENPISEWSDIDELARQCPRLQMLWILKNPLVDSRSSARGSSFSTRLELIARLGSLHGLNGSEVGKWGRRDAELWYVNHVLSSPEASAAAKDAVTAVGGNPVPTSDRQLSSFIASLQPKHPRFQELAMRLSIDLKSELKELQGTTAAAPCSSSNSTPSTLTAPATAASQSSFVNVKVRVLRLDGGKELTKKFPRSITVTKLRIFLSKMCKRDFSSAALLLLLPSTAEAACSPTLLTKEDDSLGSVLMHASAQAATAASPDTVTVLVDQDSNVGVSSLSAPDVLAYEQSIAKLVAAQ